MSDYTKEANAFIDSLLQQGYDRQDIYAKYVGKTKQVIYPVIDESGKPRLKKRVFSEKKEENV